MDSRFRVEGFVGMFQVPDSSPTVQGEVWRRFGSDCYDQVLLVQIPAISPVMPAGGCTAAVIKGTLMISL